MTDNPNLDEYLYPDLYDLENASFEPEGPFYLAIARETGGPVLELGCGKEQYDPLTQVMVETAIRRITAPDGTEIVHTAPLALRFTFPQEMERLLQASGFVVKERYGGPDRSQLTDKSQFLVYVCGLSDE